MGPAICGAKGRWKDCRPRRAARRWGGGAGNQGEGTKQAVRRQAAVPHPEAGVAGPGRKVGGVAKKVKRGWEAPEMQAVCGLGAPMFCLASVMMLALGLHCPTGAVTKSLQIGLAKGDLSGTRKSLSQGFYFHAGTTSPCTVT